MSRSINEDNDIKEEYSKSEIKVTEIYKKANDISKEEK